jgi:hypothetical protein
MDETLFSGRTIAIANALENSGFLDRGLPVGANVAMVTGPMSKADMIGRQFVYGLAWEGSPEGAQWLFGGASFDVSSRWSLYLVGQWPNASELDSYMAMMAANAIQAAFANKSGDDWDTMRISSFQAVRIRTDANQWIEVLTAVIECEWVERNVAVATP